MVSFSPVAGSEEERRLARERIAGKVPQPKLRDRHAALSDLERACARRFFLAAADPDDTRDFDAICAALQRDATALARFDDTLREAAEDFFYG